MNFLIILGIQCTLSLLAFFLIGKWYVVPHIKQDTKYGILEMLLVVNIFRYLPLSLFMPGQVDTSFPAEVKEVVAYGDFISGVLALLAVMIVWQNRKAGMAMTWLFSIVSIADIIAALTMAMSAKVYELSLGANYFTVVVYVPLLIVIQALILKILLNKSIP